MSNVESSKYFGTRKCCHPQISDLVIVRLVFFRESSRKIINKLTSRLPSCESSIPGRFALFECNSNDVRICKKISQESCHQEIPKPKSDICGWQHLWGPKDLLNKTDRKSAQNHIRPTALYSSKTPNPTRHENYNVGSFLGFTRRYYKVERSSTYINYTYRILHILSRIYIYITNK